MIRNLKGVINMFKKIGLTYNDSRINNINNNPSINNINKLSEKEREKTKSQLVTRANILWQSIFLHLRSLLDTASKEISFKIIVKTGLDELPKKIQEEYHQLLDVKAKEEFFRVLLLRLHDGNIITYENEISTNDLNQKFVTYIKYCIVLSTHQEPFIPLFSKDKSASTNSIKDLIQLNDSTLSIKSDQNQSDWGSIDNYLSKEDKDALLIANRDVYNSLLGVKKNIDPQLQDKDEVDPEYRKVISGISSVVKSKEPTDPTLLEVFDQIIEGGFAVTGTTGVPREFSRLVRENNLYFDGISQKNTKNPKDYLDAKTFTTLSKMSPEAREEILRIRNPDKLRMPINRQPQNITFGQQYINRLKAFYGLLQVPENEIPKSILSSDNKLNPVVGEKILAFINSCAS